MAQITWRNVDAPQLSIRDIALAGEQVTAGFDRFAQALATREANLRTKATDAAVANVLSARDVNQLGSVDPSTLDPRADVRAVLEARNAQENALMQRAKVADDLETQAAMAEFGDRGVSLLAAAQRGDAAALAEAKALAESNPRFRRVYASLGNELAQRWDSFLDNQRDQTESEARIANDAARTGLANRQFNLQSRQYELAEKERLDREAAYAEYERQVAADKTGLSDEDFLQELNRAGLFEGRSSTFRAAFAEALNDKDFGRSARIRPTANDNFTPLRFTPTEDGSVPAGPQSISDVNARISGLTQEAEILSATRAARVNAQYPEMEIINNIDKYKDVTADEIYEIAGQRGISKDFIENIRSKHGLDYPAVRAILDNGAVGDADLMSRSNYSIPKLVERDAEGRATGELVRPGNPLRYLGEGSNFLERGERAFEAAAARLERAREDRGMPVRYQAEIANTQADYTNLQNALTTLSATIDRKRSRNLDVTEELKLLAAQERKLAELASRDREAR